MMLSAMALGDRCRITRALILSVQAMSPSSGVPATLGRTVMVAHGLDVASRWKRLSCTREAPRRAVPCFQHGQYPGRPWRGLVHLRTGEQGAAGRIHRV